MKTYKLIKTYPGSFPLGHLAILDESEKYYNLGTTTRSLDYIENHPENWQHVCYKCHENVNTCKTFGCKKDYEILSFKDVRNNSMFSYTLRKNGLYIYQIYEDNIFDKMPNIKRKLQDCLNNSNLTIHSVKRLSDGEIFTIGDRITGKSKYNCIINIIELNLACNQIMFNRLDEGIDLLNAKHIKKPLFTTEDGVDIFEGDNYYFVNTNLDFKAYTGTIMKGMTATNPDTKKFSTKKAAENYIKMNKPCLSLQNVLEITNKMISFHPDREIIKRELTKIVKQKLK